MFEIEGWYVNFQSWRGLEENLCTNRFFGDKIYGNIVKFEILLKTFGCGWVELILRRSTDDDHQIIMVSVNLIIIYMIVWSSSMFHRKVDPI